MDVWSKRCGCGQVFRAASLMSRETRCVACLRKEATATMAARSAEVAPRFDGGHIVSGMRA
jgi:hypothetical protein